MTNPMMSNPLSLANPMFKLEYPQSLGTFTSYADAQRAVDALADQNFPVANIAIVGTDLKLVERVTGRKTWGTVFSQGLLSGLSTALMIALMLVLFTGQDFFAIFVMALVIGTLIGVGFSAIGHLMSRGQRDFTSVSQTIPSKFEILCEHKVAAQARELLSRTPAARSAAFDPGRYAGQAGVAAPGASEPAQVPPTPYATPYPQGAYPQGPYAPGQYPAGPYAPDQSQGAYSAGLYPAGPYAAGPYATPYPQGQPGQAYGEPAPEDVRGPAYPQPSASDGSQEAGAADGPENKPSDQRP